jgi:hypothetical protein
MASSLEHSPMDLKSYVKVLNGQIEEDLKEELREVEEMLKLISKRKMKKRCQLTRPEGEKLSFVPRK